MGIKPASFHSNSITTAIFFGIIVISVLCIALVLRLGVIIGQSKFNSAERFTLGINFSDTKKEILSFDPKKKSVSKIVITGDKNIPSFLKSVAVMVDGEVLVRNKETTPSESPAEQLLSLLFHPQVKLIEITRYDLIKSYLYAQFFFSQTIDEAVITYPMDDVESDKIINRLLADNHINEENLSIQIVNGTTMPGVGKRLERIIENMGGNIIAVTSSKEQIKKGSLTFFEKESYTSKKLSKSLSLPAKKTLKRELSDIIITIGEDTLSTVKF